MEVLVLADVLLALEDEVALADEEVTLEVVEDVALEVVLVAAVVTAKSLKPKSTTLVDSPPLLAETPT